MSLGGRVLIDGIRRPRHNARSMLHPTLTSGCFALIALLGPVPSAMAQQGSSGGSSIRHALEAQRRSAAAPDAAGSTQTLILERRELRDPGMGGIVSHTILVPRGWNFDGGVRWTNHPTMFVHFVGSMTAPDGPSLHFDYNRSFGYNDNEQALAHAGQRMGQTLADGTMLIPPPQRAGEAAERVLLPILRPQASSVRLVSATQIEEAERQLREFLAPMLQSMEQQNQISRANGLGLEAHSWIRVERVRLAYTEDGQPWEEEFVYSMMGTHSSTRTQFLQMESGTWQIADVRSTRAPLGRLDAAMPQLVTLARSLRETPQWSISLQDLRAKIAEIQHRGAMDRLEIIRRSGEQIAKNNREISDMQMRSWRSRQDFEDRVHKAVTKSIRDWRATDGSSIAVDHAFGQVFQDPSGNLILTNDPSYDPRRDHHVNSCEWDRLNRIDPFQR